MKILILVLILCFSIAARATHIVGGDLLLSYIDNNRYMLGLNLYYDDIHANPMTKDDQIVVSLFSKRTNALIEKYTLPQIASTLLANVNGQCGVVAIQTRIIRYRSVVNLPVYSLNDPLGYYISWERCCRNEVIENIVSPGDAGATYYMEVPPFSLNGTPYINSTPVFRDLRNIIGCKGEMFSIDFGADDVNRDSLVYSMSTPLRGHSSNTQRLISPVGLPAPYEPIFWTPGYSTTNSITGNPALNINRQTGQLYVKPDKSGLFVFAVTCEEYRLSKKIGEVRREFQIYIDSCPRLFPPVINLAYQGKPYSKSDTLFVDPDGQTNCFPLTITDGTVDSLKKSETIQFKYIRPVAGNVKISGLPETLVISNAANGLGSLCFSANCVEGQKNVSGAYPIKLVASDNRCPISLTDTLDITLFIKTQTNHPPVLTGDTVPEKDVYVGKGISLNLIATDPDVGDVLTLKAQGRGFELGAEGMTFTNFSEANKYFANYNWNATCSQYKKDYKVLFTVEDKYCFSPLKDSIEYTFHVKDSIYRHQFILPNLFTPNSDGNNEYFEMPAIPPNSCESRFLNIEVFNRWGSRVFYSDNNQFKWQGGLEQNSIYYYNLKFSDVEYKSWLHIMH